MMNQHMGMLALAAGAWLGVFTVAPSHGATITDDFNDYGTTSTYISGMGTAGGGWAGGWTGTATTGYPQYQPNATITFNSPNYSTAGNQSGTNDGMVVTGDGNTNAAKAAYRSFSTSLTDTIWISALTQFSNAAPDVMLILDATSGTSNYVGIRNEASKAQAIIATGGIADNDEFGPDVADNVYPTNAPLLLLTRIQIDVSGTNDRIDYWIFDDKSSTTNIPALPATADDVLAIAPSFSKTGNFFGTGLDAIGVALTKTGTSVDAIRISNDADGFKQVTSVPEPGLLGAAALGLLALRRRRR